jgi:phosphate transport system substrate-binding protein
MVILGQRWAEAYMKTNSGTTVQVTGGGSGTGIAALINGSTDICQSSRPMTDKEKADVEAKRSAKVVETPVALDALAVYVNEKNPLKEISIPALAKIYLGETKDWKEVGGKAHAIILYGRENNSGTYGYFKEHVLSKKDFAANTQTLAGTSAVANAVKGDEFGIGYGGIATSGIKALKVKKDDASPVAASMDTAQDGSYWPLPLFYDRRADRFVDWTRAKVEGHQTLDIIHRRPAPTHKTCGDPVATADAHAPTAFAEPSPLTASRDVSNGCGVPARGGARVDRVHHPHSRLRREGSHPDFHDDEVARK